MMNPAFVQRDADRSPSVSAPNVVRMTFPRLA